MHTYIQYNKFIDTKQHWRQIVSSQKGHSTASLRGFYNIPELHPTRDKLHHVYKLLFQLKYFLQKRRSDKKEANYN